MAGESPDRSKRYESSTGSTSGNGASVPGPATEPAPARSPAAAGPRDPRLAMSRERASGTSSTGVDQATAVFSRRALEEAEAGRAEGSAAVAAWVSSAEGKGSGGVGGSGADARPDDSDDSDRDAEPEAEGTAEGDESGMPDAADAEDGEAEPEAECEEGPETDAEAEREVAGEPEPAADADAEPEGEVGASPTDEAGAEPTDEAEREVAGEPEPAADAHADAEPEASGAADKAELAAGPEPDADTAPRAERDEPSETDAEADATDAPDTDSGTVPPRAERDEPSETDAEADATDAPDAAPDTDSDPAPDTDSDTGVDSTPSLQADQPTAVFHAVRPPAVDQPTAVFRAVRPPAVDQPTTTLRLGGTKPEPKPADKPDSESEKPGGKPTVKPATTPERAPERTSRFVALKPLDEPRHPKPPTASPASPASPGTTPAVPADATAAIPQIGPERTAQQPLPPKPPLDLLAELTNTPPPPPTPLRMLVRRVKIWTPLAVLLAIVFAVAQLARPLPTPTLALTADETYAFEGETLSLPWPGEGQGWMDVNGIGTMDRFGEQKAVPIGSVAKAMTAYVVLKNHPLKSGQEGPKITVDALAEKEGGYDKDGESTLNTVRNGDTLTEKQAIEAIMIPSANNIARLLARWDAGSEEAFVKKMNDAAADLGMKNTTYTDPSGLEESTVSTAEDQVKLGNELVTMRALTDITRLPEWTDPTGTKWRNWNALVPYNNAIGIKTGSTTKAGGNLLFAATQEAGGETVTVVGAILGQHTPPIIDTVNAVSQEAMVAAQDALISSTILKKGDVVGYVDDRLGGRTPVVVTEDVTAVGWAGMTVRLALADRRTEIPNEAKAGTEVGVLTVGDGTGDAVEVPVALRSDLTEPSFGTKLTRVN